MSEELDCCHCEPKVLTEVFYPGTYVPSGYVSPPVITLTFENA